MLFACSGRPESQDEVEVAADREQKFMEMNRRGSSCPTLFVWDGERYKRIGDMLGAGVVGHWVGPGQRDIPRPTEYIKIDRKAILEKDGNLVSVIELWKRPSISIR